MPKSKYRKKKKKQVKSFLPDALDSALKSLSLDAVERITRDCRIIKSESMLKRGLVYGIVYEPDVVDSHGDSASKSEIERAAHDFLPRAMTNVDHEDNSPDVDVVESYLAPCDFVVKGSKEFVREGSWVLVTRVNDGDLKKDVATGKITGYSLEGRALKL